MTVGDGLGGMVTISSNISSVGGIVSGTAVTGGNVSGAGTGGGVSGTTTVTGGNVSGTVGAGTGGSVSGTMGVMGTHSTGVGAAFSALELLLTPDDSLPDLVELVLEDPEPLEELLVEDPPSLLDLVLETPEDDLSPLEDDDEIIMPAGQLIFSTSTHCVSFRFVVVCEGGKERNDIVGCV
jgi:hypothetical protein